MFPVPSRELQILLRPRRAYGQLAAAPPAYIVYYVLFVSLLIAAAASVSAAGRVTVLLLLSLGVSWMFLPLLHVLVAAALVASVRAPAARGNRAVALLLMGHAPWSIWLLGAAVLSAVSGYSGYLVAVPLAVLPIALTFRIVHAFCLEVLHTSQRGAVIRTLVHQTVTWLIAAVYLEKAVGLVPRVYGWLS